MTSQQVLQKGLARLSGREVKIGARVDGWTLACYLFEVGLSLLRGALRQLTVAPSGWRQLYLASGSRISGLRCIARRGRVRLATGARLVCWSRGGIELGHDVSIGSYSYISNGFNPFNEIGTVRIGNNVGLGDFSYICSPSRVEIGEGTIVGQYLSVHPQEHIFESKDVPIRLQGTSGKGVIVGSNCWLGAKVTLLDGTTIGSGCVVAAGAVVKGVFPDDSIIAGVPARIIKAR